MIKLNTIVALCAIVSIAIGSNNHIQGCDSQNPVNPGPFQDMQFVNHMTFDNQYNHYFSLREISENTNNKSYVLEPNHKQLIMSQSAMPYQQFKSSGMWLRYQYEISQINADGTYKKPNKVTIKVNPSTGSVHTVVPVIGLHFANNIVQVSAVCDRSTVCSTTNIRCHIILDPYLHSDLYDDD